MVTRSMKECPGLLNQQSQERLRALVMHKQDGDYQHVKRAVSRKTAPEIINHISAINLDTAANISELLVEQILAMLDQANQKLVSIHSPIIKRYALSITKFFIIHVFLGLLHVHTVVNTMSKWISKEQCFCLVM